MTSKMSQHRYFPLTTTSMRSCTKNRSLTKLKTSSMSSERADRFVWLATIMMGPRTCFGKARIIDLASFSDWTASIKVKLGLPVNSQDHTIELVCMTRSKKSLKSCKKVSVTRCAQWRNWCEWKFSESHSVKSTEKSGLSARTGDFSAKSQLHRLTSSFPPMICALLARTVRWKPPKTAKNCQLSLACHANSQNKCEGTQKGKNKRRKDDDSTQPKREKNHFNSLIISKNLLCGITKEHLLVVLEHLWRLGALKSCPFNSGHCCATREAKLKSFWREIYFGRLVPVLDHTWCNLHLSRHSGYASKVSKYFWMVTARVYGGNFIKTH